MRSSWDREDWPPATLFHLPPEVLGAKVSPSRISTGAALPGPGSVAHARPLQPTAAFPVPAFPALLNPPGWTRVTTS